MFQVLIGILTIQSILRIFNRFSLFQVLIGILTILMIDPVAGVETYVSSPYRYSNNNNNWWCNIRSDNVSSPYRYSNNILSSFSISIHFLVSSPYRYSNNAEALEPFEENLEFQVLIGILTMVKK